MPEKTNAQNAFPDINQNLAMLDQRIALLEKTNDEFELNAHQMEKESRYESHKDVAEMHKLKSELMDIKKEIKHAAYHLYLLINELKTTAKKEEFSKVKKRVDNLNPESFISRKTAMEIIKDVIR